MMPGPPSATRKPTVQACGTRVSVVPIPGASAFTALVSVAGLVGKSITFEGFLSPKSGRRRARLATLLERGEAFVIYESPFRVVKTLAELSDLAPLRRVVVGREMTKKFEEYITGSAAEVAAQLAARETVKGSSPSWWEHQR